MPILDGFDVAKQVRANETTRHIPIIFVSAQDDSETMREGFKQHAMDYNRLTQNYLSPTTFFDVYSQSSLVFIQFSMNILT